MKLRRLRDGDVVLVRGGDDDPDLLPDDDWEPPGQAVVRAVAVDEDGQVHFAVARYREAAAG